MMANVESSWREQLVFAVKDFLFGQHRRTPVMLLNLNTTCLEAIFDRLSHRDLTSLLLTSKCLNSAVKRYYCKYDTLTYTCSMNEIQEPDGFNLRAFRVALQRQPCVSTLIFEQCHQMRHMVDNCGAALIHIIGQELKCLRALHIGRSKALTSSSLAELHRRHPDLLQLSIAIYNESLLEHIVALFQSLQYLDLSGSVLHNYSPVLASLPPALKTLILPLDTTNQRLRLIYALAKGNGKNLERFGFSFTVKDIEKDAVFFDVVGSELSELKWFDCELNLESHLATTASPEPVVDSRANLDFEYRRPSFTSSDFETPINYDHKHLEMVRGISQLKNLRVLKLSEKDYYGKEDRCSLLDDGSLLKILASCVELKWIDLSCALRRDRPNYRPRTSHLRPRFANELLDYIFKQEADSCLLDRKSSFDFTQTIETNHHHQQQDSDIEEDTKSCDSGITLDNQLHTLSDLSLSTISKSQPNLAALQLRGVRVGLSFLHSLCEFNNLLLLTLDSVTFTHTEHKQCVEFITSKPLMLPPTCRLLLSNTPL